MAKEIEHEKILELYNFGESATGISQKLQIGESTVYRSLKKSNVEFRRKRRYFILDSSGKAFAKKCCKCNVLRNIHNIKNCKYGKFGKNYICKRCSRFSRYKKKNGEEFGNSEYVDLYNYQNRKCIICLTHYKKLCIDHCHKVGRVRGLLCNNCNLGIGFFKNDKDRLKAAIKYLENFEKELNENNQPL